MMTSDEESPIGTDAGMVGSVNFYTGVIEDCFVKTVGELLV